jgi:predicted RNase H-like HicB family nuclease
MLMNPAASVRISVLSAKLTVIYKKGEDGFWIATIPEVPGAFSQGKTKAEARENVIEAMSELMQARRELAMSLRHKGSSFETLSLQP